MKCRLEQMLEDLKVIKPKILAIVGKSGSGKSLSATYIQEHYDIPLLESYTDRPKRHPDERGHTFIPSHMFDYIPKKDMIAYTEFGGKRYCCLHADVKAENTYVIDPRGLEYLKNNFSDMYDIKSVYIHRRNRNIDKERYERDKGMFYLDEDYYDYHIDNSYKKKDLYSDLDEIVQSFFKKEKQWFFIYYFSKHLYMSLSYIILGDDYG